MVMRLRNRFGKLSRGGSLLVDQARKEWKLLDKGFYTVAAELTNKFGKKFYKFI